MHAPRDAGVEEVGPVHEDEDEVGAGGDQLGQHQRLRHGVILAAVTRDVALTAARVHGVTCHVSRVACCLVRVPAGTAGETSRRRGARRSSCPSLHLLPGPRLAHTGRTTPTLGTAAVCNNTKTDDDEGKENMFKMVDTSNL